MDDFDASVPCLRTGLGLTKGSFLLPLRAGYSNETLPAPFEERGGGSVLAGTQNDYLRELEEGDFFELAGDWVAAYYLAVDFLPDFASFGPFSIWGGIGITRLLIRLEVLFIFNSSPAASYFLEVAEPETLLAYLLIPLTEFYRLIDICYMYYLLLFFIKKNLTKILKY